MAWGAALLGPALGGGGLLLAVGDRYPLISIGLWACVAGSFLGGSLMLLRRLRGDMTYGAGVSISRWSANMYFFGFFGSLSVFLVGLWLSTAS
jgi:hypothetical protein